MKEIIKGFFSKIGYKIISLNAFEEIEGRLEQSGYWVPPGHFYSPFPDLENIRLNEQRIFTAEREIHGIDLREAKQLKILVQMASFYPDLPFSENGSSKLRFQLDNGAYPYADAIVLYCMLRLFQPNRIIEVGSGYSSAAMLDINSLFFRNGIDLTFIDPNPSTLKRLMKRKDRIYAQVIGKRIQDIDPQLFDTLSEGDVLFIDSTHVSKVDSDVNHLFFEIFPRLNSGVIIHIHDIIYPFEYFKDWIYEGRAWQEIYLLRAFLMHNSMYEIVFFTSMMLHKAPSFFEQHMPLCLKGGGGSFWMRKIK